MESQELFIVPKMLSCDVQQVSVSSTGHLNFNKRICGSREQIQLVLSNDTNEKNMVEATVKSKKCKQKEQKMFLEKNKLNQ